MASAPDLDLDCPLDNFTCKLPKKNTRYRIPEEYVIVPSNFHVKKVLASDDSYEKFVSELLHLASGYTAREEPDGEETSSPSNEIILNEETFVWGGLATGLLKPHDDGSWTLVQNPEKRVVFVPSAGRSDLESSKIKEMGEVLADDDSSHCILVVQLAELAKYVATHGDHWLVVAPRDARYKTVGDARHCVIKIARCLGLQRVWVIDDSMPVKGISKSRAATSARDGGAGDNVSFVKAIVEVEGFAEQEKEKEPNSEGPLAMVGITSTFSLENLKNCRPQFNRRSPAGFVYILLDQLPADLNYDRRLPYKEDIIFAARILQKRASVCVYRELNFEDTFYSTGGCSEYHKMPTAPASETAPGTDPGQPSGEAGAGHKSS